MRLGLNPELTDLNDCDTYYKGWLFAITCSTEEAFEIISPSNILIVDILSIIDGMQPNYYLTNEEAPSLSGLFITGENLEAGSSQ